METLAISMAGLCQLAHSVSDIKVLLITDYKTTRLQDYKTTRLQDYKTTRLQDYKTTIKDFIVSACMA